LAVQDFCHLSQGRNEMVGNFIRSLEQTFCRAYGYDKVCEGTHSTFMHGQLQEGLKYSVMSAPAVSGAQTYPELCLAAKNEERRQLELAKRKQYVPRSTQFSDHFPREKHVQSTGNRSGTQSLIATPRRCYICNGTDHIAKYCKAAKSESSGRSSQDGRNTVATSQPGAKKVEGYPTYATGDGEALQPNKDSILQLLYSDSEDSDESVNTIRVSDKGSFPQCVRVLIQGVPAYGIIDTAADITIIGGQLFRKVASVAHLKKKHLKHADKTPRNYDQRPFRLDGRMDLTIAFGDKEMTTSVCIKLDAVDQLLLSEGIVSYHSAVKIWRGGGATKKKATGSIDQDKGVASVAQCEDANGDNRAAQVPTVRVSALKSIRVLPHHRVAVPVEVTGIDDSTGTWVVEPEELDSFK